MANTVFRDSAGEIMLVTTNQRLFDGINAGRVQPVIEGIQIDNMKFKQVDNYKAYHNKLRDRIRNDDNCELLDSLCTFIKSSKHNESRRNKIQNT